MKDKFEDLLSDLEFHINNGDSCFSGSTISNLEYIVSKLEGFLPAIQVADFEYKNGKI